MQSQTLKTFTNLQSFTALSLLSRIPKHETLQSASHNQTFPLENTCTEGTSFKSVPHCGSVTTPALHFHVTFCSLLQLQTFYTAPWQNDRLVFCTKFSVQAVTSKISMAFTTVRCNKSFHPAQVVQLLSILSYITNCLGL